LNNQTKNLFDDNKHSPQAKMPVLNWHTQKPNITHSRNAKCYYSDCVVQSERVNLEICNSNGYVIVSVAWYTYRSIKAQFINNYD